MILFVIYIYVSILDCRKKKDCGMKKHLLTEMSDMSIYKALSSLDRSRHTFQELNIFCISDLSAPFKRPRCWRNVRIQINTLKL